MLIALLVIVIVAVIAFVVGDRIFRSTAEAQIEQSVSKSLPNGVTGKVRATIGGGSALLQWLQGSFDDVTLTSQGLKVAGAPAAASVHITGLPVQGGTIGSATASFTVGQAAFEDIPQLRDVGASPPRLGNGTVSTTLTRTVLAIPLKVAVVLTPSLSGQTVQLSPTSATLEAGPAAIPATAIVQQLLPNGVSLCAASYLPKGVEVTTVQVKQGEAVVGLAAQQVDLNTLDSAPTGTCG
ncbi:MAG: DUF2993 domain-containing protein [Acidobacteria bacterium]|nr:DUF2993 domain-containing protein [Acidobacteriota bacterium]